MDSADAWLKLQRMKHAAERIEAHLAAHREAIGDCHKRVQCWLETARLCTWFRQRAERQSLRRVATAWRALAEEAEQAAELERDQAIALDQSLDELEISAQCARSDYLEMRVDIASESATAAGLGFPIFGSPTAENILRRTY